MRVLVPLRQAHRSSHGAEEQRESILVEWTSRDGAVGWAECPTLGGSGYVTETTEVAWSALIETLVPTAMQGGAGAVEPRPGLLAAPAALADAALDARLVARGTSLAEHLAACTGARTRSRLPWCAVLADVGGDLDAMAARAVDAVRSGASMVKVKIAPGRDTEVIRRIRLALGDDRSFPVAADANGSYSDPDGSVHSTELEALDRLGLAYLEQPLAPAAGLDRLAELCRTLTTPVAADESVTTLAELHSAISAGVRAVNVKPSRLGGMTIAAEVVVEATAAGLDVFVGGMFELGIGRAASAALASLEWCGWPTDLGPSWRYVDEDICVPIGLDEAGRLLVPDGPGCGRVPDPGRLAEYVLDQCTFA